MPRGEVMKHMFKKENLSLICPKQVPDKENSGVYISKNITGHKTCSAYNINYIFPLYLYPEKDEQQIIGHLARTPNLKLEIMMEVAYKLELTYTNEKESTENTFAPIDMLDYIYAVLHSPTYREKYKEFLKIDFPKIPYPKNVELFWKLVKHGGELRQIHLLESPVVENYITKYPIDGDNLVCKPIYRDRKVYINDMQYFDNVSDLAWSFHIGGYQPAQKWLMDRKDHKLEFDDILHYQKIIVALSETDKIMKKIDSLGSIR
jgi:predicted helicase